MEGKRAGNSGGRTSILDGKTIYYFFGCTASGKISAIVSMCGNSCGNLIPD